MTGARTQVMTISTATVWPALEYEVRQLAGGATRAVALAGSLAEAEDIARALSLMPGASSAIVRHAFRTGQPVTAREPLTSWFRDGIWHEHGCLRDGVPVAEVRRLGKGGVDLVPQRQAGRQS